MDNPRVRAIAFRLLQALFLILLEADLWLATAILCR